MTRTKSSRALLSVVLAVLMVAAFMPALTYSSFAATAKKATKVTKLNHTGAKVYGKVGNKYVLKYKLSPSKLTSAAKKTVWKSSDSSIVKVYSTKGKHAAVKVKGVGTAKITVYTKANTKAKAVWSFKTKKAAETKTTLTGVTVSAPNAADPAKEVKVGTKLEATVAPADAKDVTYQWYADDKAIDGATSADFTVTAAQMGKAITVKATSKNDVTSTATAKVSTVKVSTIQAYKANTDGKYTTAFNGGAANVGDSFQLKANTLEGVNSLSDAVSIQWYRNSKSANGSAVETPISGATSDTYTLTKEDIGYTVTAKVTPKDGVTVTGNTKGANESAYSIVTIGEATTGVTGQVSVAIKVDGKTVTDVAKGTTLTAAVTPSDAAVSYQWYKDGVKIDGATSATYTANEKGSYTVKVSVASTEKTYSGTAKESAAVNVGGDVVGAATLTTNDHSNLLTTAEESQYTYAEDTLTATAQKMGGTISGAQVAWYKNGEKVKNADGNAFTSSTFNVPATDEAGTTYYAEVSNGGTTVKTNTITVKKTLTVSNLAVAPVKDKDKTLTVSGLPTPADAVLGTAYTATVKVDIYDGSDNYVSSTSIDVAKVDKEGNATVELGSGIINQLKNGYKVKVHAVVKGAGNYLVSAESRAITGTAAVTDSATTLTWA
jgi:hypothetical protein